MQFVLLFIICSATNNALLLLFYRCVNKTHQYRFTLKQLSPTHEQSETSSHLPFHFLLHGTNLSDLHSPLAWISQVSLFSVEGQVKSLSLSLSTIFSPSLTHSPRLFPALREALLIKAVISEGGREQGAMGGRAGWHSQSYSTERKSKENGDWVERYKEK